MPPASPHQNGVPPMYRREGRKSHHSQTQEEALAMGQTRWTPQEKELATRGHLTFKNRQGWGSLSCTQIMVPGVLSSVSTGSRPAPPMHSATAPSQASCSCAISAAVCPQHADQRKLHSRCSPDKDASSWPSPPPQWGSDTTHPPAAHAPRLHQSLSWYSVSSRPGASNVPAALRIRPDTTSPSPHLHPHHSLLILPPHHEIPPLAVSPGQRQVEPHHRGLR